MAGNLETLQQMSSSRSRKRATSEMMKDYLGREATVTERLVHGKTVSSPDAMHQQSTQKAARAAELVRQINGGDVGGRR